MKRLCVVSLCLAVAALLAPALSHAAVSCSRPGLQQAVDLYLAAQSAGDLSRLPLAKGIGYWENAAPADIRTGFITKAMKIDHHRSIFDTSTCQSFTELVVTDKAAPYVFGTRLRVDHDQIAEIEILWTTTGYWLFNADSYLQHSSAENWGPIPVGRRDSRATLVAAANAYLDAFLEGKVDLVPWGYPCERLEGGLYLGKGLLPGRCAERGQYRQSTLRRGSGARHGAGILHVRRRGPGRPPRSGRQPHVPGAKWQAALRAHHDPPADVRLSAQPPDPVTLRCPAGRSRVATCFRPWAAWEWPRPRCRCRAPGPMPEARR